MGFVSRKRNRRLAGFTLIELLLILVLIGVFLGLVVPRVGLMYFGYEFHTTVEKIEKTILYAQQNAISHNRYYRLTIDRYDKSVALEYKDPGDPRAQYAAEPGRAGEVIRLPEKCELALTYGDTIYFYPDGRTSRGRFSIAFEDTQKAQFSFKGTPFGFSLTYL
jgi:type II secretory pathway pseudopilin PulG